MTNIISRASDFAFKAHADCNHLYDGKPYSVHLTDVARVAFTYGGILDELQKEHPLEPPEGCWSTLAVAGAFVHDCIEDARCTYNDVRKAVGNEFVAEIAYALTNEKGRTRRERANDSYYAGINQHIIFRYVKLCDRISNVRYSFESGSSMFSKYVEEMAHFEKKLRNFDDELEPMWDHLTELCNAKQKH